MKVKLGELAIALEKSDVVQGYVDIEEGKVLLYGEELSDSLEHREETEEERLEHVFSIEDHWQRYVALPNVYETDERAIMLAFADSLQDQEKKAQLLEVLQGAGAVGRFGRHLKKLLLTQIWQEYLHQYFLAAARDWCEENHVEYEE